MKTSSVFLWLVSIFICSLAVGQDHKDPVGHVVLHAEALQWGPAPPGLPPGAQLSVLLGDPRKPDLPYVFRAKLPDGYQVPPHWHPTDESVTVLQGSLLVGQGEQLDRSQTQKLIVGSFFHMPKTMRHFVVAEGETIIQVHGIGPFGITYVNPADDPRRQNGN